MKLPVDQGKRGIVGAIANVFLLCLAVLAPLMFLVGIISLIDQWGAHHRFLNNLESYGKTVDAVVSYIDEDYNRAGVSFIDASGTERSGTLSLRYYTPEVIETIRPGATIRVIYIDRLISESEKTALADFYSEVKKAPPVLADYWWVLGISWLIIAIKPQFVFLGMVDYDQLIKV